MRGRSDHRRATTRLGSCATVGGGVVRCSLLRWSARSCDREADGDAGGARCRGDVGPSVGGHRSRPLLLLTAGAGRGAVLQPVRDRGIDLPPVPHAYFLREPDAVGFSYWYLSVARGMSLDEVSDLFAKSSEFRTRYGSLDNAGFVDLVYRNVLGRDADAHGRGYWVERLRAGLSRGRVMRFFSESGEYRARDRHRSPVRLAGRCEREDAARGPAGCQRTGASRLRPAPLRTLGRHRP